MVLANGRQLRRLGGNAVIFELERRMDGATYRALDPDGVSILALRVLLDRIGADPTEPIVRAQVHAAVGMPEPVVIDHFDVRLRDWLVLNVVELDTEQWEQVGQARQVRVGDLAPDEHSPGGPHWV
jgi:hypothetical protein